VRRIAWAVLCLVLAPVLPAAAAPGQDTTRVETGEIGGSPFRIQIPPRWNRNLVMFLHGYLPRGTAWSPLSRRYAAVFLERGFALAEPGYSRQGWSMEEGLRDTEALRRHFAKRYGRPDTAFVTGFSLGGALALATIESYPVGYAGAMPMCGPLTPALVFCRDQMFDMLVTFEALFGRHLPPGRRPVADVNELPRDLVEQALASDSSLAERFALHWDVRREDLADDIAFYHLAHRELVERAGGQPVDNRNTVYSGFGPVRGLNDSVPRYAAQPRALAYLVRHYTPSGKVRVPVLALHTTYDPGVPPRFANAYGVTATAAGNERWFVQQRVEADGHCNVRPALVGQALDELRTWAATSQRPEPGTLR
jgi:pimeloyl-ACP methyl ester carboxylesterase